MIKDEKFARLEQIIASMNSVIIGFSGGVDSVFLAKVARDVLPDKAIAATADSPSLARSELESCINLAKQIRIMHKIVRTTEIENPEYLLNPSNRCYFCKISLYAKLAELAKELNIAVIANGLNYDDLQEYRAGNKAAEEFNVRSPLVEARMTKEEIRKYSAVLGLPTFDKPAMPCLASRIPTDSVITPEKLLQVEQAELYLRTQFNLYNLRARHFGNIVKIEADKKDLERLNAEKESIGKRMQDIGFEKVEICEYKRGGIVKLPVIN